MAESVTSPAAPESADPPAAVPLPLQPFQWQVLVVGCVVCLSVCAALAAALRLPVEPGFDGSLLAGFGPVGAVVKVVAVVVAALAAGALIASFAEDEGALFCAAVGLAAVAVRCGPMRPVLIGSGRGVFAVLAVETVLLMALLGGGWYVLRRVFDAVRSPANRRDRVPLANEVADATPGTRVGTLLTQMLATVVCLFVLVPNADHAQTLGGVAVAGFIGTIVAYSSTPLPDGVWYWTGPAAVGVVGYLLAMATGGAGLPTGEVQGWAAALARPTPLDYASLGTAGSLFGYWTARRMYEVPPETDDDAEAAVA